MHAPETADVALNVAVIGSGAWWADRTTGTTGTVV